MDCDTHIELATKTGKPRLAVDRRKNVKSKLLRTFDDDMVTVGIPADHMLIFRLFQQSIPTSRCQ